MFVGRGDDRGGEDDPGGLGKERIERSDRHDVGREFMEQGDDGNAVFLEGRNEIAGLGRVGDDIERRIDRADLWASSRRLSALRAKCRGGRQGAGRGFDRRTDLAVALQKDHDILGAREFEDDVVAQDRATGAGRLMDDDEHGLAVAAQPFRRVGEPVRRAAAF